MKWLHWLVACGLVLGGCDDDGSAGGFDADTDSTVGGIDATPQPEAGPPDMGPQGPDMAPPPDRDMAPPPDRDMAPPPDPDMGPECAVGAEEACGDCAGGTRVCSDDGTWSDCAFPPERCNGLDDDCDDAIDEDFAGLGDACETGVGACATAGEVVCNAEGDAAVCNAAPGPAAAEACDGADNDCDGVIDEEVRQACYGGPDGTEGVGACVGGMQACADGVFGACAGQVMPNDEACDGVDDDCDGVVDESQGGALLVEVCYEGPDGSAGQGICVGGQRTCVAGAFGPCDGQVLPGQEICDLADNDCNGEVDDAPDGCECVPGEAADCYSGAEGTAGVGLCSAGRQVCGDDARFGPCDGEVVPAAEQCDGADNDCNGEVDDDIAGTGAPCADGVGACRADGQTICDPDQGVICAAVPGEPGVERCNATDDDCDGSADEGTGVGEACARGFGVCRGEGVNVCNAEGGVDCNARAGAPRPELCNDLDDDCDGNADEGLGLGDVCRVGVGACERAGELACAENGEVRCSVEPGRGGAEACNDIDDDCDGRVDEGNPGGGQVCNTGEAGICARGLRLCQGGGFVCEQQDQPGQETCDGEDEDCDGTTDEGGEGPLSRSCYDGPRGTENNRPCRAGVSRCQGGQFGACQNQVLPRPEVCDEVDNDCNGEVDDLGAGMCVCERGQTRPCYTGPEGTEGVGVCRGGMQTCRADGLGFGNCENQTLPGAEVCDGVDNDCNGSADDAPGTGVACAAGRGECRADGRLICDARSGELVCDARPGDPVPETCDRLDNDCDGNVDNVEGLGDRCTNGVGECVAAGNQVCDFGSGALRCNGQPGEPTPEVCDGEDDDCDGRTDEDSPGVGQRCVVGVGECQRPGATECRGAQGVQCGAVAGEPQPEICDGRDNDCNRAVDDNPRDAGQPCTVGVGACQRPGVTVCGQGELSCNGQAGGPGLELCDEVDNDCDGQTDEGLVCDVFRSCAHALQQGQRADGIYVISADGEADPQSVWCDQTTDGGGWTLVGSTLRQTFNDQASAWYQDLVTLGPAAGHAGIWDGLRPLGRRWDVRFTCRAAVEAADQPMDVDLSFYDVPWYSEITTGTDAESCFSESNGDGAESPAPARRNNLDGRFRRKGDPHDANGYMEGEDACDQTGDFTVDFDNRGMDANQNDGTDWGEDDGQRKCGASGLATGQWFVFARERPRVAVVGLARTGIVLRSAGMLAENLAYDAALPGKLTTENYDTIVIGRYSLNWGRMTQDLKEALDVFGRNGGNIVTESDGAAIFMSVYDQTFVRRNGAPDQLDWFGGRIGAGSERGDNTPITHLAAGDPILAGVANPFRDRNATEFFHTLADVGGVEFPVTLDARTIATFPGNGTPEFPQGALPAVVHGRYCSGNAIFASFDWEDNPAAAGLGPFVVNMVNVANAPPPGSLPDECKDARRSDVLQCGTSRRNIHDFMVGGRLLEGCAPNNNTQAMFVTRSGVGQLNAAQVQSYLNNGGIIIGEFNISDELYNLAFNGDVAQGARTGQCSDEISPAVQLNPDNGFWQDNAHERPARTGCGHDLSAFPSITPLGGWNANTVQIAYRDRGKGRLWMVEADWQDGGNISDASLGLMRYMGTHRAQGAFGRGATFPGVRNNQNIHTYIQRGFQPCFRAGYEETTDLQVVRDACVGDVLMMACRRDNNQTLQVAAVGSRTEVFEDVGNGNNAVNGHNGVNWYFSGGRSWGYAPAGQPVNRNSCDVEQGAAAQRLCWHTNADRVRQGWRCGNDRGIAAGWERVMLHRLGDVPVDIVID